MEKIKVLYFVDRLLLGGIQKLIVEWVERIDKNLIQIDFLLLDDGKTYEYENELKMKGFNLYKLKGIWVKTPFDYMKYGKALDDFFDKHHDYKVVHMHSSSKNYIVLKYADKYKIPVRIAHSHNIDFQTKNSFKKLVGNVLKKPLIKYSTDYFACAKIAGEWLFGKKIVQSDKFRVIHNAIDYDKFKFDITIRNKIRKEFNIAQEDSVFGNVGRFSNQKNHEFLIDIFQSIHSKSANTKLILVGIGEKEEEIRKKVDRLGLKEAVIFAGFRKNANEFMQAMDVFILPSLHEGLPVVGVEAQAAGLPVFTSKDVVTSEVKITDNLHFISLEKNADEWAEIILGNDLTRKASYHDLEREHYFVEDVVKELSDFYRK